MPVTVNQLKGVEDYIKEEVVNGRMDIFVPLVKSSSSYSAIYQLPNVDSGYDTRLNKSIAKYYGARRIYRDEREEALIDDQQETSMTN